MDFDTVRAESNRLGPIFYLATASSSGGPHVVPVHIDWHDGAAWCLAGTKDVKTRNVIADPRVCLHSEVSEATGWDHLMVWGQAELLDDVATKRKLWDGVFSYDLDDFVSGGADNSPDTGFLRIEPRKAVVLRRYGFDGREAWRVSPA